MKIDHNVTFLKNTSSSPALARGNEKAPTTAVLPPAAVNQAQQLSPSPLLRSTDGDFDAARVAEIRESISAGRYQVNTTKIADGLLASVRELLNSRDS